MQHILLFIQSLKLQRDNKFLIIMEVEIIDVYYNGMAFVWMKINMILIRLG